MPENDLAVSGQIFRASPRQADVIVVARKSLDQDGAVLRQYTTRCLSPNGLSRWEPALSGRSVNNYAVVQVDKIVPVDVFV